MFDSGSLLVLPTTTRLGWKSMQVANTLAYYDTAIITAVKRFIVQAPDFIFPHFKRTKRLNQKCKNEKMFKNLIFPQRKEFYKDSILHTPTLILPYKD